MAATAQLALDDDKIFEIVDGQLEEKPMAGAKHGGVGVRLSAKLFLHVDAHQLGGVYGPDTNFTIGKRERVPDVSFVSAARIPPEGEPESAWPIAPDLAVEVISPNDAWEQLYRKLREYFQAGVRLVWYVYADSSTIRVFTSVESMRELTIHDVLDGGDVLAGFELAIEQLFDESKK